MKLTSIFCIPKCPRNFLHFNPGLHYYNLKQHEYQQIFWNRRINDCCHGLFEVKFELSVFNSLTIRHDSFIFNPLARSGLKKRITYYGSPSMHFSTTSTAINLMKTHLFNGKVLSRYVCRAALRFSDQQVYKINKSNNNKSVLRCYHYKLTYFMYIFYYMLVQCQDRWRLITVDRGLKIKGVWTKEEDFTLETLVNKGFRFWKEISSHIPGRTPKQCRERWQQNLHPSLIRTPFTPEEDDRLLKLHSKLGKGTPLRWTHNHGLVI